MGFPRTHARCLTVLLSAALFPGVALAQAPAAPHAGPDPAPESSPVATETPADPTDEAPEGASPEGTPKEPDSAPAAEPAATEPTVASEPAADAESTVAPATAPAATPPGAVPAPTTSDLPSQSSDDDYDGATDGALVEEKPGPKNLSLGVAVDMTFALGRASNFISSASIQGLSLDLRYYAWGNIGIGAGLALDSLSKKSTATATWENATITGTQVRELSYTPITLKGYYAWREQKTLIPYVAAGLGAARAVKRLTVGITGLSEASWHFAMVPEVGLQIPIGPTQLLTNVRLNYLPPSAGVEEHVFANFSFGLSIQ